MAIKTQSPSEIDWGLKPLHTKMLEALVYLDAFCIENNIDYCLAFGSALGAKRHGGFIPWDDDVDVYMTVEGYAAFRRAFYAKGDQTRFYLQESGAIDGMVMMPKFRMNGTTFIEENCRSLDMHHGIYLDIFLLHGYPPTKWAKKRQKLAMQYVAIKRLSNQHYSRRRNWLPVLALLRLFPKNFGLKRAYSEAYRWDATQSESYSDCTGQTSMEKMFFPKFWIFPAKRISFSGIDICVPRELDQYLTMSYGNYMQVPTLDQVRWCQHASEWSVTEDFRQRVPNIYDFSDESF